MPDRERIGEPQWNIDQYQKQNRLPGEESIESMRMGIDHRSPGDQQQTDRYGYKDRDAYVIFNDGRYNIFL